MNPKPLIIFDLDGTLLDSIRDISACCNRALERHDFPTHKLADYRTMVGWGADHLIHAALPLDAGEESFRRVRQSYEEIYLSVCAQGCTMFDGVKELLDWLHGQGALTGVVSNKPQTQTDAVCRSTFGRLLDGWMGQHEGIPPKPSPAGVLLLAERLNARCMAYVGDSNVDIETGRNAGLPTFGVGWGIQPRDKLVEAGADQIADNIPQLRYLLLDILSKQDYHNW